MKILVVSDTHGRDGNLEYVLEESGPLDLLIHCGDVEGSEDTSVKLPDVRYIWWLVIMIFSQT